MVPIWSELFSNHFIASYIIFLVMYKLQVLLLAVIVAVCLSEGIHVDLQNSLLKDSSGRYRLYHGVNAVYKIFPFHPITDHFDSNSSLCEEDLMNLQAWGMNVIRLHVAWEGVEPQRGQYNFTYIQKLREIVQSCDKYGISVILDSHQDLFSKKFCGEGFPDWAVKHNHTFPFPLPIKLRKDAQGYPLVEDCLKQPFALFYTTYDVMRFQQDFFTDADGIAGHFANMWIEVAKVMHDLPNVLGYEIVNEPSGANLYDYPYNFLWPGVSNNKFLLPFYKRVNKAIRSIDKQKLLFFEPSVVDVFAGGFVETPGGIFELEKQVFSYHLYCPLVTSQGQPTSPSFCKKFDELTLQSKFDNYKALGVGGFLTEFGALSDSTKSADEVLRITKFAEDNFQSWVYWQFKYFQDVTTAAKPATTESFYFENGTLQTHKVRALTHPYAYAICGEPVSSEFTDSSFRFTFQLGFCGDYVYSEIYINEPLYFPNGFGVLFEPACPQCHLEQIRPSYYKVVVPQTLKNKQVTVRVVAQI